jgi:predicted ATP-grasp superfamily ATP-dependent carboligase
MRVLVLEAVAAGLVHDRPESSPLLPEGWAMLTAVLDDLAALPEVDVLTVVHDDLARRFRMVGRVRASHPPGWGGRVGRAAHHGGCRAVVGLADSAQPTPFDVYSAGSAGTVRDIFRRLIPDVDAVLVIAPETGGLLAELVEDADEKAMNCTPPAIALCTDKLRLAEHLLAHDVPTIPTRLVEWSTPPAASEWPVVVKPRDGAGCELTFLVRGAAEWRKAHDLYRQEPSATAIAQPYAPGRALSVAGLFGPAACDLFPVGEQDVACGGAFDNCFHYRGGMLPARLTAEETVAVLELVRCAAATVPGLCGYVGFDVLLPHAAPRQPILVEINPRLTTSYIGYRRLCRQNLMAAMLAGGTEALTWSEASFSFDKTGNVVAGG